jgi:nucleotide-binding universal stress UspA family protein
MPGSYANARLNQMAGMIVVGVDGSDASREAIRWAAEEARIRDAQLVAVHAWSFVPVAPLGDAGVLAMPAGDLPGQLEAESEAATATLDSALTEALGDSPDIAVDRRVVEGDPGEALVTEAAKAELVVVGSHGRTGLKAALLGSVSRHVVDHARCPVVVVKSAD